MHSSCCQAAGAAVWQLVRSCNSCVWLPWQGLSRLLALNHAQVCLCRVMSTLHPRVAANFNSPGV